MKLKAGDTIYTVLRHVSSSGMFRVIDAYVIRKNELVNILAILTDEQKDELLSHYKRDHERSGFRMSGCGMDMGFALVFDVGRICFPKGFIVTDKTIHRNGAKNGTRDNDGGYALNFNWI